MAEIKRKSKEEQLALVRTGNRTDIAAYVSEHTLCSEAEVALVQAGCKESVVTYMSKHKLSAVATQELMKSNELIEAVLLASFY